MEIIELNRFGMDVTSKTGEHPDKTFGSAYGFIQYSSGHNDPHSYIVPDCKVIRDYLARLGFTEDEERGISYPDESSMLKCLAEEGPMGETFLKSYAFVAMQSKYRETLKNIRSEYELQEYLRNLEKNDPHFKRVHRDEEKIKRTEAYAYGVERYERAKKAFSDHPTSTPFSSDRIAQGVGDIDTHDIPNFIKNDNKDERK